MESQAESVCHLHISALERVYHARCKPLTRTECSEVGRDECRRRQFRFSSLQMQICQYHIARLESGVTHVKHFLGLFLREIFETSLDGRSSLFILESLNDRSGREILH